MIISFFIIKIIVIITILINNNQGELRITIIIKN